MISKFRLELKSAYERLVIAQRVADMLDKFLRGRLAPLRIGSEQGGIKEWDDIVIEHACGRYEHLQIKRQTTAFCDRPADKNAYVKARNDKANKPKPASKEPAPATTNPPVPKVLTVDEVEGSVLDSALKHLGIWSASAASKEAPERTFSLILLGAHIDIKDELTINHLDELCCLCRQDGLNLDELKTRKDGPTQRVYTWLTTWCGFNDWAQVVDTLRRLTVVCIGNESSVRSQALTSLGHHFAKPEHTLDLLTAYITNNASDVAAIGCHSTLRHLQEMLLPGIETWAQFDCGLPGPTGFSPWSIAGTYDVRDNNPEPGATSSVVKHLWGPETRNSRLRIYAKHSETSGANLSLSAAILRLALHLQSGSQSLLLDESAWRTTAGHQLGQTLGLGERDIAGLPWYENTERLACATQRAFVSNLEARTEAEALADAMDELVWQCVVAGVANRLNEIGDTALMGAMDATWQTWSSELAVNATGRQKLLEQLLYPVTEGINAAHALRLGPRTVEIIEIAIVTLLLVAVGTGEQDASWQSFPNCGEVLSIALRHWSGPKSDKWGVRELSDDKLMSVVGPRPAAIVILSGVSASPTTLFEEGMADDAGTATSMAAERRPQLLVTRHKTKQLLLQGTLHSVQEYFGRQLRHHREAREAAIESNGKVV